ncbi:organic cation transporter protein-like [Bicyclus anynana]|uniref:Organic cation transporter protein-like n=1 Tax=Bicyclus anynana TaxID=110368 RepID=A0ABM3LPJ0_BICAN|nr:organic cation transporter protein-like [Bicyclus anynana]
MPTAGEPGARPDARDHRAAADADEPGEAPRALNDAQHATPHSHDGNTRINSTESGSCTTSFNVDNEAENEIPSDLGRKRSANSKDWTASSDGDKDGTDRIYKDSGEALELALLQLGPFGLYQRYVLFLLLVPNVLAAMHSLNYVFVADQVPFRCVVPECEGAGSSFANATLTSLLPPDRCRRYEPLPPGGTTCERDRFHHNRTVPCERFLYETMDTIYAEFGLACSEWRRTLVGTLRNAALPLALLLTGYISDGYANGQLLCVCQFGLACSEWRRTLVGTLRNAALPLALLLTGYISDGYANGQLLCVCQFGLACSEWRRTLVGTLLLTGYISDGYANGQLLCVCQFGLACSEWRRTLVGTLRNAALPLALLLTGYISDGWGRRTALCALAACAGALGVLKSFMPNYRAYVALEFLEAALGYGFNSAAYVMMVELARPSLRVAFAAATGVGYGLGGVLFALLARRVRRWRRLLRAVYAPALLLPLYGLLLHESARWLHVRGQRRRAARNVRQAARWNKVTIDEDLLKAICEDERADDAPTQGNPWLSLLRSRALMLRLALCGWCWAAVSFVYYGLTINSVALSGDKYTNFALNMAMEIVASLLIMMALERFGRRRSIFVAFLVCGLACIVPYFVAHSGAGLGMFFVGKLAITFAFNSLYVFTAELFPTDARSSALAAASLLGRLGSVLAPQTPLLSVYVQALLYGGCSASAALLVLLAPETRRAALPQCAPHAESLRAPAATRTAL